MSVLTLRYRSVPTVADRDVVEAQARRNGARITWQLDERFDRAYALVEAVTPASAESLKAIADVEVIAPAIIALAICPSVPEALPFLEAALSGPGRPAGVSSCEIERGAAIVEWDPLVTAPAELLRVVDVELARFRAGRVNALLAPMPLAWWTAIAADGLHAPEIAPNRVLEALLEEHDVVS